MTFAQSFKGFWNHPAGPRTIFFWAPTIKWGISIANIADMQKPAENISYPQQLATAMLMWDWLVLKYVCVCVFGVAAITATGLIWTRYSTVITPINYNLMAVNMFMAGTGLYQLSRKLMSGSTKTNAVGYPRDPH